MTRRTYSGGVVKRTVLSGGVVERTVLSGGVVERTVLSGGQAPEATGPVLIPAAPSFPGMDYAQFIPANLVLDGTLALNDPIGNLPLYGDLIPGGSFIASGTARPIVADDGTGRVGMSMDGVDGMPEITGLSLDLTGGCTVYVVARRDTYTQFAGWLRGDAGASGANSSVIEMYANTQSGGSVNQTITADRLTGVAASQSGNVFALGTVHSIAGVWSSDAAVRGVYDDGANIVSAFSGGPEPSTIITRIQIAGYNQVKFDGFVYTLIIYDGVHTLAQIAEVTTYLRDNFNGGSAF